MAARANPLFDIASLPEPLADAPAAPASVLARLAQIHAEAVETARLANLLGRSGYAIAALGALAVTALAVHGRAAAPSIAWAILMAVGLLAMVRAYAFAIRQPFERAALRAFAQDMRACLLYAGFAWGAGAFLVLSASVSGVAMVLFAAAPAVAFAGLLREREAVLLFVAPAAGLSSLACAMRPISGGALAAGAILMGCAVIAVAFEAMARFAAKRHPAGLARGLAAS